MQGPDQHPPARRTFPLWPPAPWVPAACPLPKPSGFSACTALSHGLHELHERGAVWSCCAFVFLLVIRHRRHLPDQLLENRLVRHMTHTGTMHGNEDEHPSFRPTTWKECAVCDATPFAARKAWRLPSRSMPSHNHACTKISAPGGGVCAERERERTID